MKFGILGPLVVEHEHLPVEIPGPRLQAALTLLLLHNGSTLTVDQFIDGLWGEQAPRTARAQIHNIVSKLRRALPEKARDQLTLKPGGYAFTPVGSVDAVDFTSRVAAVRKNEPTRATVGSAVAELRGALSLWRGEALSGVEAPFAASARARLNEERRAVWEMLADLELGRGDWSVVVPELTGLLVEHPYWEGIAERLARALYQGGRQADALAVLRDTKARLAEDYGLDAGAALTELEQAMLRGELRSVKPQPIAVTGPQPGQAVHSRSARPALLPAPGFGFVGRREELARLDTVLERTSGAPRIALVSGPAGVGKTSLAVRWAHTVADRFPDGQLYVDLHGYDRYESESADRVLERFLLALGVRGHEIPVDPAAREDLYRSTVHGRRLLLVLDNACDEDQVRPLIPGSTDAMTVITSRDSLSALAADSGALTVGLGVLPLADAIDALALIVGTDRVEASPDAAAALARVCGGLPLALRISAVRLTQENGAELSRLAGELAPASARLAGLQLVSGGHVRAVSESLHHSYRRLDPEAARHLRLLADFAGPDVGVAALGAMAAGARPKGSDTSIGVHEALRRLVEAHLVERMDGQRYSVHDLVRLYGQEHADGTRGEREEARDRALGWYLASARAATTLINPSTLPFALEVRRPWTGSLSFADRDSALGWFSAESGSLEALTRQAVAVGDHASVWQLAHGQLVHLLHRHQLGLVIETASTGERSALALGLDAQAGVLADWIGVAYSMLRDLRAIPAYQRAMDAAQRAGDPLRISRVIVHRGNLHYELKQYAEAAQHHEEALSLLRGLGDQVMEAGVLANLALSRIELGDEDRACGLASEAAELAESLNMPAHAVVYRGQEAFALLRAGRPKESLALSKRCLVDAERFGDSLQQARITDQIGLALEALGRTREARATWTRSLALFEEIGSEHAVRVRERLGISG